MPGIDQGIRRNQQVATRSALLRVAFVVVLLLWAVQAPALAAGVNASGQASAPDGPGAQAFFDLARKDCVGTARNTTSKVWFTVADGVLSDVYFPTIDNTNVKTLQYVVTDGKTFTDLQTRDMTYTLAPLRGGDRQSLVCHVTTEAKNGKYRIFTDYFADPNRNTVVMNVRFVPLVGDLSNYKLYLRYDPTINGNGGGGSGNGGGDSGAVDTSAGHRVPIAFDTVTTSQAANRDYATPVYSALDASRPFLQVSNGFVDAASDGLKQLDTGHALTGLFDTASNGNLVQTTQANLGPNGRLTLALGFGTNSAEALNAAEGTLRQDPGNLLDAYTQGWKAYDDTLTGPDGSVFKGMSPDDRRDLTAEYYLNANIVKASEDKTFPGALVASLASPWGQAISAADPNNLFFGSYREVFARDVYEAWTGLLADGDLNTARDVVSFLFNRQQLPDGSFPRNSLVNGKVAPDSFGTQLDEASYPTLMAFQLGMTDGNLYQNHIRPAANFVISHGPAFGVERWEEQNGFSPSTIAAEIAGLISAADIADKNGDGQSAQIWRGVADDWQRSIKGWTVTTNGPLAPRYFIRLSKTGDPNAAISYNVGNGGPTLDQRSVIDAGFLELVRLGLLAPQDADVTASLPVVDGTIKSDTASGPGWHRYNGDGYGDGASDGHPWAPSGQGTGHVWPVLTEERGEYALLSGDRDAAMPLLKTMRQFGSGVGLIPEQDWELPDLAASPFGSNPTTASIGFQNGHPAGSAAPLTWAAGAYVRLLRGISAGKAVEQPANTVNRYVTHGPPAQTSLTVTAPADQSAVSGSPVTVSGTSAPGNTIFVAATNTDNNSQTTLATATAQPDGSFTLSVPVTGGTTVLNIVAVSPAGATAHAQRSVVFDFTPGTVLLDMTDPANDDNGPGNYAYPTAGDFHAGAFDITDFRVILSPDGSTVTFKLQTRDLSPTFGSPLGAQLVDVYVHDPAAAAADTSTAASFPQRNYQIAPAGAWHKLLEVQGFGQRYVDAHGNTLGTISISANAISRFITFSVPEASLGQPGPGWGFTVVLTGQDGFSPDQARSFAATPQPYNFGVCATASADPHCTVDPNTVPKAMDVLTPSGVSQANELDYTLHNPVVVQDVTIP
jgi:glucoamylase